MDSERKQSACREYEARLESYLAGAEDSASAREITAHLERCAACREALEDARLARELLREGLEPAAEPSGAFATRVLASIRAEQFRRQQFWRPLGVLASRLALVAAMLLLVLAGYVFQFNPVHNRPQAAQTEVSAGLPEPASQPATQDEILLTLAGSSNGH